MIIRFYNGNVNFDSLEELCKTTKKGTSAYHLIEAGKFIGLDGKGYRLSLDKVKDTMLPAIVHVTTKQNYYHYLVLYEIRKKYVVVADPAVGIHKMKISEFNEIYNNTILTFHPIRILPKEQNGKSMFSFIKNIFQRNNLTILQIIVYSLLSITFIIMTSFSMQFFLLGIESKKQTNIFLILILFLIICLVKFIFIKNKNKKILKLSMSLNSCLAKETFKKIISLPYNYYHNKTTGEIMDRFQDIPIVNSFIIEIIIEGVLSVLLSIFSYIVLYILCPSLSFYAVIIFVLVMIMSLSITTLIKRKVKYLKKKREEYISFVFEAFSNYETIKGSHREVQLQKQFDKVYYEYYKEQYEYEKLIQKIELFRQYFDQTANIILLWIGSTMILNNSLSITRLITFEFLFSTFLDPAYQWISKNANIKEGIESFHRISDLFVRDEDKGFVDKHVKGNILINHLFFSYDDQKVLEDINLFIKAKQKVMIVGESGIGKSTLFHLLMGYEKIPRNMIYLDGIDINDYTRRSLDNQIFMVSQNENLFTDTIYHNLTFFEKKNPQKIVDVCNDCETSSIISKNSLGYFMPLEEGGLNLSGGERQRIILARSLLLNSKILLIDEGLNQIDEEKERIILKNIFKKYQDKTILIISHRYRNIDLFDQVINLTKGVKSVVA